MSIIPWHQEHPIVEHKKQLQSPFHPDAAQVRTKTVYQMALTDSEAGAHGHTPVTTWSQIETSETVSDIGPTTSIFPLPFHSSPAALL